MDPVPKNPPEFMQHCLSHRLNVRAKERWPQLTRVQVRWIGDNFLPTGLPFGLPEEVLDCACGLHLGDPTAWSNAPSTI